MTTPQAGGSHRDHPAGSATQAPADPAEPAATEAALPGEWAARRVAPIPTETLTVPDLARLQPAAAVLPDGLWPELPPRRIVTPTAPLARAVLARDRRLAAEQEAT